MTRPEREISTRMSAITKLLPGWRSLTEHGKATLCSPPASRGILRQPFMTYSTGIPLITNSLSPLRFYQRNVWQRNWRRRNRARRGWDASDALPCLCTRGIYTVG
jgi:hypothetical protein